MNAMTDFLNFMRRERRKAIAGMAASLGMLVGIPLTVLVVYGVGYRNWSPYWSAPVLLAVPILVCWAIQTSYERKINKGTP